MSGLKEWLEQDAGSSKRNVTLDAVAQDDSLYVDYDDASSDSEMRIKADYKRSITRKIAFGMGCFAATLVIAGYVITYGDYPLEFGQVYGIIWDHILNGPPSPDEVIPFMEDHVVWNLRLPRVIVAIVAGFGLAVAGAVMQSTLKNPMADSYTTGVSAGAAFGATLSIVLGVNIVSYDFSLVLNAFVFSLAPTMLIVAISRTRRMSSTSMILAGLAVMYIFSAMTAALKLMAEPDALASLYRWQVGTLNNMTWDEVPVMLAVTVIGSIIIMLLSGKINILASGDDDAKALGIDAQKLRVVCLVIVSLITAAIVSYTGTIGFVGLVSPHVARIFIGSDNRYLIPASAFFGALLMLASDFIGRVVLAPSVFEVGVVTAFIGGPMFLFLILRQHKEVWT